ncbi:MAG: AMP-binding protein [Alphaproteobacteria bacterium]|nr:AMP-binding protein [Alphaproteobacteria bacterium]
MNVHDIVSQWAARTPGAVALIDGARRMTYAELDSAIRAFPLDGVRPGDRAMIVVENRIEDVVGYFACNARGAWPVVVNAKLTGREIDEIREHAGARTVIRKGKLGELHEAAPEPATDIAALIYTSGTTGKPKGVMLTHDNLMFVAKATGEARRLAPQDRVYAVLPVSHILGLTGVLLGSLLNGAAVHLVSRFDPAAALASDITVMIGTPSMYQMLGEYARRKGIAPPKGLRLISSAGAPLDMATKTATEEVFGQTLHNGYGITECGPTIMLTPLDAPRTDCGIGRLMPGVEAKTVNDELYVRSPGVMKGYYRDPEQTAAAVDADGWFKTGDLARYENDSWFITGRAKEMIIRFGFNVYPAEIEGVLNAHPAIARSAVIGRDDEIVAFIEGSATRDDVVRHAAANLAPYKRPTDIRFLPALPLSPAGKILKSQLAPLI